METKTTQYRFSHGKEPRGYGLWMMSVTGKKDKHLPNITQSYRAYGIMSVARSKIIKLAKEDGFTSISYISILP